MVEQELGELVRRRLLRHHPPGIAIDIIEEDISMRDGFWYVPVLPSEQPRSTFEYYDALAEVETELSLEDNLRVVLVPSLLEDRGGNGARPDAAVSRASETPA